MKRILAVVLSISLFFQMMAVVNASENNTAETENPTSEDVSYDFSFETVAENNEAKLLFDKSVNSFRLINKKTGKYFDTKVLNGQSGNDTIKNKQKSDFSISYFKDKKKATKINMDSYTDSIKLKQVKYEPIENGMRCIFKVGEEEKLQISMFPMFISKERMENLVLQYMNDSQRKELLGKDDGCYREAKDRYIRKWNAKKSDGTPTPVPIPKLRTMNDYFYKVGKYTSEELKKDNIEWGQEFEDTNIVVTVPMEYVLDGKDLIVRIPADKIVNDEKYPVCDLTMTPYLLSGSDKDDGYLFVPDGCGGIVNFNSGKSSTNVLSIPIYGRDLLKSSHFYTEEYEQSILPVIGMKKNDIAVLGIIEEGAALATVSANVSGKMDEFNKVYTQFDLDPYEKVPLTDDNKNTIYKYIDQGYKGNITMRYKLLENEDANYTGMAKVYKNYLKQKGELKENDVPEHSPLFVEMIASVPKRKTFLGIPYTTYSSMTSFNDAQGILDSLKSKGIQNIVAEYTDWCNGAAKNSPLKNIKIINSIGGKKELSDLLSYSKNEGIEFFPSLRLLTTYSTRGISGNKNISRVLSNDWAVYPDFNIVTRRTNNTGEWLISPNYIDKYFDNVLDETEKLNIENLGVTDAGTLLYGDYNEKNELLCADSMLLVKDGLNKLSEKNNLLFSNANSYAFGYAKYIEDLPAYSSGRRAIDYSVPFVQMVLENDVPYSMEAFNQNSLKGFEQYLLKAVETKSNLKWTLTNNDEKEFYESYKSMKYRVAPYFQTKFSRWEDKIGDYYNKYDEFYQMVKNAEIKSHQVINENLIKVEYTNNLIVYINYEEETQTVDGYNIPPLSYIIKEN